MELENIMKEIRILNTFPQDTDQKLGYRLNQFDLMIESKAVLKVFMLFSDYFWKQDG